MKFQYTSMGKNVHTTINNTKHPQYNHTILHNIPSQTKFNLNTMIFLGETNSQTIVGVYFQSPTLTPMRVLNGCSFDTLKSRIHNTF